MYPRNYYNKYQPYQKQTIVNPPIYNKNDERFGGFIAPFILGGITGSVLSRPNYYPYQPYAQYPVYNNSYYYYPYPY